MLKPAKGCVLLLWLLCLDVPVPPPLLIDFITQSIVECEVLPFAGVPTGNLSDYLLRCLTPICYHLPGAYVTFQSS